MFNPRSRQLVESSGQRLMRGLALDLLLPFAPSPLYVCYTRVLIDRDLMGATRDLCMQREAEGG